MKRILALMFLAFFAGQALAQTTFEVNGLKYTVTDDKNSLVSVAKSSRELTGAIEIPKQVKNGGWRTYTVTSIPDNAFIGCTRVTSVIVPNSVTSIGEGAFSGCSGLTSISLPFVGCQPCYQLFDMSAPYDIKQYFFCRIFGTSYYPGGTEIRMPTERDTFFCIPTSLNEVIITGDSYIPYATFFGCRTLTSIIIGNNVPCVDGDAFGGCSNLTSVTIGSSVTTIIEGGLLYDGGWFASCNNLTTINVNTENAVYSSKDGVLFNKDQTTLICCPNGKTEYTIPNTVTSIGSDAFGYECGLTSLTIPESVTDIDNNAFQNYHTDFFVDGNRRDIVLRLTSITINSDADFSNANLCFSKDGIFYRVLNKSSVEVRSKMESYGTAINYYIGEISIPNKVIAGNEFNVIKIGEYAFGDSRGLKSISIPNSVTSIGEIAFQNCSGLTSVTIPNSVTSIGYAVFSGCSSLESITLPFVGEKAHTPDDTEQYPFGNIFGTSKYTDGVETLQYCYGSNTSSTTRTTFYIPTSLKEVIITGSSYIPYGAFSNCNGLTDVTIGNSVTSIGGFAFDGCSALTSVTIGNSVTSIGGCAFQKCSGLTSVTIPNSVTSIGLYAFRQCSGMTSVTIGNSVTSIGQGAFSECYDLLSVTIPNSVETIGDKAFLACFDLVSLIFDEGSQLSSIGEEAFYCSSLTSVTIPNSVTSIGYGAFEYCSSLASVTIPNSVTSIGDIVFGNCSKLTEINVKSDNTTYASQDGVLFNKDKTTIICYPAGKTERAYSIPNSVTNVGNYAFYNCNGLTSVTIPNSVTSIGDHAFEYCNSLTSVTIPNSVTNVGDYAFKGCNGLTSVTIPNSVTSIGDYAFEDCSNATLYCEVEESSKPLGWSSSWNSSWDDSNRPVKWGCWVVSAPPYYAPLHVEPTITGENYELIDDNGALWFLNDAVDPMITVTFVPYLGYHWGEGAGEKINTRLPIIINEAVTESKIYISQAMVIRCEEMTEITTEAAIPATCTEPGKTAGKQCHVCNTVLEGLEVIPALGHAYDTVSHASTCTNLGYKELTCTRCNDVIYIDTVAAYGHTYNSTITAPTCTEVGYTTHTCSVCEHTYNSDTVANGHTYNSTITAPTCTDVGYTTHTCSVCEYTYNSDTIAANGHTYNSTITAPTCTEVGYTTHICSVCELTYNSDTVAANGHTYNGTITAPTCTAIGYTTHTCSVCNHTYNSDTVPSNGHTEVVDAAKAPTCTETGLTEGKHCSVCNTVLVAQQNVKALGHKEVTDAAKAPTCTETGLTEGKHCSVCNAVLVAQEDVAALGHTEVTDAAKAPTCTETGLTEGKHCSVCNTVLVAQQNVEALGHKEVVDAAVAATCTEAGKTEGKHCSVCEAVLVAQEVIPAKGHSYGISISSPTCIEAGYTTHTCSVCNHTFNSDTVPANGHTEIIDAAVAATCTEPGKTEGKHCSVCNAVLKAQETIPATGHTVVVDAAVAATCTEPGKTEGKHCSVCNAVLIAQEDVAALGHRPDSIVFENIKPATCTINGSRDSVVYCSVCQEEISRDTLEIVATGHKIVIDSMVEPTCTQTGLGEGKHCSECNEYDWTQELLPALGHDFINYVYNNDATTEADGTETAVCEHGCGATDTRVAAGTKLPKDNTAIADDAAQQVSIYAHHNIIVVENADAEIRVYNAMGALVATINETNAEIRINVSGVYVVRVGNTAKRVMIND